MSVALTSAMVTSLGVIRRSRANRAPLGRPICTYMSVSRFTLTGEDQRGKNVTPLMYNGTMNENTAPRTCTFMVEFETDSGYRFWSSSMTEDKVSDYIALRSDLGYMLSDIDHAGTCHGTCGE